MLPAFTPPEPLRVVCDACGTEGFTFDYEHPDQAVECSCCPVPHDHAGLGCRTVTIFGAACLRVIDPADLLEAAAEDLPATEATPTPSQA